MFPQSAPPQQPQAQAQPEPGSSAAGSSEPAGRGGGMDGGQGASRPGGGGGGVGRPPVSTQEVQHVQNLIERCMQQYLPQVRACMHAWRGVGWGGAWARVWHYQPQGWACMARAGAGKEACMHGENLSPPFSSSFPSPTCRHRGPEPSSCASLSPTSPLSFSPPLRRRW